LQQPAAAYRSSLSSPSACRRRFLPTC
jgi:hypothetical protein